MVSAPSTFFSSRSGRRPYAVVAFVAVAVVGLLSACASSPAPASRPGPRTLPPDSLALLQEALRLARPAYATQDQALRAGIYAAPALADRLPAGESRTEAANSTRPGPTPAAREAARGAGFVIQIAAVRDLALAEVHATAAGERFPELEVLIEQAGEHFRIALGAWSEPAGARAVLPEVQRLYPDAWLRRAGT